MRSRKEANVPPPVLCPFKKCPLVWRRVPPPECCHEPPKCDECSEPLGKFSWTCATSSNGNGCDYDMCDACYSKP